MKLFNKVTLALFVGVLMSGMVAENVLAVSEVVTFSQSTSRNQSKTVTLPAGAVVTQATVNTGSVTTNMSGNQLQVNVSGGASVGSIYDAYKYSQSATGSRTSTSTSFPYSIAYSSNGYTGTLYQNGTYYWSGGSVVEADSKYVSGQTSSYYNSGGYSGSLSSYIDSYTTPPALTQYISGYVGQYQEGICDTRMGPNWMHCFPKDGNPSKVSYSSGGYTGSLSYTNYVYDQSDNYSSLNGHSRFDWSRTWYYAGTVSKPQSPVANYLYEGTVYRSYSDNRVYTQNYSGTVYSGGYTPTYAYTVTIQYTTDFDAPTGTLTQTPTGATNGNVTLNLTSIADTGGAGYYRTKLPNGTFVTTNSASEVVTSNGTYSFVIYDNAGNSTTKTITISNIDKTLPTGDISQTPLVATNGDVTLNLTAIADTGGSGYYRTKLPNGTFVTTTSASEVVTSNGTYNFVIYDNAGNSTTKSITVSNIDKIAPTGTLSQTPTSWTNGNVTLNLTSIADTGGSGFYGIRLPNGQFVTTPGASQTVAVNGSYSFTIYDRAGNSTTKTIWVTNIDRIPPNATLTQTPTDWTNGNVMLNLSNITDAGFGVKNIQLPDGSLVNVQSLSYLVTTNGTYTFVVYDNAGNSTTKSITISNIERVAPTGTLSQTPTSWTNGNVTLNLTGILDTGGSMLKNIQLPNGTIVTGLSASQVVTANGSYSFVITDNAGNSTTKTIVVGNIDKGNPTGTFAFIPGDTALTIRYDGIDNSSGVKSIILPNSTVITGSTASFTVTTPGTYTAIVEDNVGNKTNIVAIVQAPNVTITREVTDWTNRQSYALTVTTSPRYVAKAKILASFEGASWLNENQRVSQISNNGTYEFKVNDGGIVATGSIDITNFDRKEAIIQFEEKARSDSQATYNIRITDVGDVKP